ncbi:Ribose-phosphate pyrophosphokinase 2 [bacterium HR30]|nr:Ribose-phosphate pyrophosphokinase 2 [bacterium HR30]
MSRTERAAIFAFPQSWAWARAIGEDRGLEVCRVAVHRFPDGEVLVRVPERVPPRAILVEQLHEPNPKLFPTLLAADALRRAGAREVTLVAPYLPYMRQDAVFRPGEPISQRVLGRMLRLGFDRVLTVEAHLHRVRRLTEVLPGRSVSAAPAIAAYLEKVRWQGCLAGPDAESTSWVQGAAELSGLPWVVGEKERRGDRRVKVVFRHPLPSPHVMLVDDIASSGATLAQAARALTRMGAERIEAVVVHAIFAPGAEERMRQAGIERVVSCNTVPHPTNRISCVKLLAEAL